MQKDVIYIDTEDDITSIIGKVKASSQKIVVLVPPKRIGAIQSAVNLKLVNRTAQQEGKHLVLVSSNHALVALAASAGIPVSRNLQSKPELAEIPALEVDDEDVIDGADIDKATTQPRNSIDGAIDEIESEPSVLSGAAAPSKDKAAQSTSKKSKVKVPNFNNTRKKLLIGGGIGVVLIGFLVWALFFASHAKITVSAHTSNAALNTQVTIGSSLTTDLEKGTMKATTKTTKKDISVDFAATGKKDAGTKATGTVRFTPTSSSVYLNGATIAAGTTVSSNSGAEYTTNEAVVFDSDQSAASLARGKTVGVTAKENGTKYNGASGTANGPSGFTVAFTGVTSGGTDKTITVVQQSDVDQAQTKINESLDSDSIKSDLAKQFDKEYIIIDGSFKSDVSGITPSPTVGSESSDGKAKLSGSVTYSLTAIPKTEANTFLDAYFAQQIDGKTDQKVYSNGVDKLSLTNVSAVETHYTANVTANGKIGPKIDEKALKEYAKGKRYGEIQAYVEKIEGVQSADVAFSPFWVKSAPKDVNRITVEFKVDGE